MHPAGRCYVDFSFWATVLASEWGISQASNHIDTGGRRRRLRGGLFAGLAAFDDATNSDRKVWTTAILAGVGGAVGGYFLGRALDKRGKSTNVTWKSDGFEENLIRAQWPASWIDEISKTGQGSDVKSTPGSRLPGKSSVNQPNSRPSSLDTNYLYLVSAIRKLQRVETD